MNTRILFSLLAVALIFLFASTAYAVGTLTPAPTSLAFGTNNILNTNSGVLSYSLTGAVLTGSTVTVTAPTGYLVSLTAASGYASSVVVNYTAPTLAATTIYVIFTPTSATSFSGNITNVDNGDALAVNVALTGTGTAFAGTWLRPTATGNWSTLSWENTTDGGATWNAASAPTGSEKMVIPGLVNVTVDQAVSISGQLVNNYGGLAISGGSLSFTSGSTYELNSTSITSLPTATWAASSTIKITAVTSVKDASIFQPDVHYGSLDWNSPTQAADGYIHGGITNGTYYFDGNVLIENTGTKKIKYTQGAASYTATLVIGGNLTATGGILQWVNGAFTGGGIAITIGGNLSCPVLTYLSSSSLSALGTKTLQLTSTNGTYYSIYDFKYFAVTIGSSASYTLVTAGATFNNTAGTSLTINGTLDCASLVSAFGAAATFTLSSGATLKTAAATGINGSFSGAGTKTFSTGANYTFNAGGAQVTGALLPATVNNLTVGTSGTVLTLTNGVTASGTCSIASGASIVEAAGKYVIGTTQTTQAVGTGLSTLGGVGVSLNAGGGDDLGNVSVVRTAGASGIVTVNSSTGIARKWTITSDNAPAAGRDLTLTWDSGNDNSKVLTSAQVWKSTDGGTTWNAATALADLSTRSVTVPGVTSFSQWTIGDGSNPLPVEMTSFTAAMQSANSAMLKWSTATEVNNSGFEIQRRAENTTAWAKVGFVTGAGTSNSPKEYTYQDVNLAPGVYVYRIKQIDNNGAFKYSASTQVDAGVAGKNFELLRNYPNPFNPATNMQFSVPQDGYASLKVYNMLGQEVATLFDGMAQAGHYISATFDGSRFASGVYFSRLQYNGKSLVQRMLMTK